MAQSHPLDRVIRRLAGPAAPTADAQRLVQVRVSTGRAVTHWFFRLWGRFHHYLVSDQSDPMNQAQVSMPLRLQDLDHTLAVEVDVQVACPPGQHTRVAEALFDRVDEPGKVLELVIHRWLYERSRDSVAAFVRRHYRHREEDEEALAAALRRETGLEARVHMKVCAEEWLKDTHVEVPELSVRVSDYDEPQVVGVNVVVGIDWDNVADAVLHHSQAADLPTFVLGEISRFIRTSVPLRQFGNDLKAGPLKDALVAHLEAALRYGGRRVHSLMVEPREPAALEEPRPEEIHVWCRVREYPEPIRVDNSVVLRVRDLVTYRAFGSPDLTEWLQRKLDSLIPQLLFDVRYIDLLVRFGPLAERIKRELGDAAAMIGCEVRHFVTIPGLEPLRLKDGFPLEVEGSFETRLHNVQVRLKAVLSARIPDLEDIEPLLNARQDVPALMRKAVVDTIREVLHTVEPERFYMRFSYSDRHVSEPLSLEAELVEVIRNRLQGAPFHADVGAITLKPVDTALIERFRKLQAAICPFAVPVASLHGGKVTIKGEFRVIGVEPDGWHRFQVFHGARLYQRVEEVVEAARYGADEWETSAVTGAGSFGLEEADRVESGLEEIRTHLENHLRALLQTMAPEDLRFRNRDQQVALADLVAESTGEYVSMEFGLRIRVSNVGRALTLVEAGANDDEKKGYLAQLKASDDLRQHALHSARTIQKSKEEQIRALMEARADLVMADGAQQRVAEIDRMIAELRASLEDGVMPTLTQLRMDAFGRAPVIPAPPPPPPPPPGLPAPAEDVPAEEADVPAGEPAD